MCLTIKWYSLKRLALRDIVCYKYVSQEDKLIVNANDGQECVVTFRSGRKVDAVISHHEGETYICQNMYGGHSIPQLFGKKFAFLCGTNTIKSIEIAGINVQQLTNVLVTPYRDAIVELGKTYKSKLVRDSFTEIGAAIHSFKTIAGARYDCGRTGKIVKCIIPRWSWYYKGMFCTYVSYASDTIIYGTEFES